MATTNALDLAKKQYDSGTLNNENSDKLLNITRDNIAKAGGNREVGLKATREQLAGLVTTPPVTATTNKITTDSITGQTATNPIANATTNKIVTDSITGQTTSTVVPPVTTPVTTPPVTKSSKTTPPPVEVPTPTTIDEWKKQGSNIATLEQMIEKNYGTVATNENGVLKANIGGVDYQWNIDGAGNPIKTKVGGESIRNIYDTLKAGGEIPDTGVKTTKEYSRAKSAFDIYSKYNGMTEDQLYSAYVNGEIGSTLEKELINNPSLALAKEKYNKKLLTDNINNESKNTLDIYNKGNGKEVNKKEEISYLDNLSNKIFESFNKEGKDIVPFKDYMDNNYPDLKNNVIELNNKNLELKKLADERDGRLEDIIKSNPGISINRATMLAARDNKDINAQIQSMSYEIANLQANINYDTTMAEKDYNYQLDSQERQSKIEAEKRGMAFDLYKTARGEEFATKQTQESRQYQQAQIEDQRAYELANQGVKTQIITDPATGNQSLINSATGEIIKTYDTGLKPETISPLDEAKYNLEVAKFDLEKLKLGKPEIIGKDENGENIYGTYNKATGGYEPIIISSKEDLSSNQTLINKYPNEASFKNNNPTGITWGISNELKQMFGEAGINYDIGTARPSTEGGNYIKFATVEDGLKAYQIALTQRGDDVYNRLKKWVGTAEGDSYAKTLMTQSGITMGAKFSELSDEQLGLLMTNQLKKESPNYYKELSNIQEGGKTTEVGFDTSKSPQYINYIEKGKIPTGLKPGTKKYNDFINESEAGYIEAKNESLMTKGFKITNPKSYSGTSEKQKEAINEAINNVNPFIQSMDKLIALVDTYGTETKLSDTGKKMNQEIRNAQLLAKEIYNLGVLNGPDLSLMESIISNPTDITSKLQSGYTNYGDLLRNGKKTILDNAIAKANSVGLDFMGKVDLEKSVKENVSGKSIKDYTSDYFGKKENTSSSGAGSVNTNNLYNKYYK